MFKSKSIIQLFLLIPALAISLHCSAQDEEKSDSVKYHIETNDGNQYLGRIIYENLIEIHLQTEKLGKIVIKKLDIKKMTRVDLKRLKGGEYWAENFQETRYFWQPTAYGLKKGEGYYQNVWIFFNQFAVGLSDNFSIGGGLVPIVLLGGDVLPVWANLKFSFPVKEDKYNIGFGALIGAVAGEEKSAFGILYTVQTFGSRDKNASIGVGWAYGSAGFADRPTITFSAMARVSRKGYFLTENYLISTSSETVGLVSVGGRSLTNKVGIDYGIFIPVGEGGGEFVIPWLGITVPLNGK